MSDFPFLDYLIFLPLVGGLLLGFAPKGNVPALRYGALGITLLTFVASLGVLANFDTNNAGFQLGTNAE